MVSVSYDGIDDTDQKNDKCDNYISGWSVAEMFTVHRTPSFGIDQRNIEVF